MKRQHEIMNKQREKKKQRKKATQLVMMVKSVKQAAKHRHVDILRKTVNKPYFQVCGFALDGKKNREKKRNRVKERSVKWSEPDGILFQIIPTNHDECSQFTVFSIIDLRIMDVLVYSIFFL